jgi:hypothetical protein
VTKANAQHAVLVYGPTCLDLHHLRLGFDVVRLSSRSNGAEAREGARRDGHALSTVMKQLSDIEDQFVCQGCGRRGADVRPDYHGARQKPASIRNAP